MTDFGLAVGGFDSVPRKAALAFLKLFGIKRIEPGAYPGGLGNWIENPPALKAELDRFGIRYDTVHIAREAWDLSIDGEIRRRNVIKAGLASLHQAAELGARIVVVHPNGEETNYTTASQTMHIARTQESLGELADKARQLGLKLALENMIDDHRRRPGVTMQEIKALIAPHRDVMGICFDTGHALMSGLDPASQAAKAGSDLLNIHIHDNHGGGDEHLLPGKGILDWAPFLETLKTMQYPGLLTFEVMADGLPFGLLAQVNRLSALWRRILETR